MAERAHPEDPGFREGSPYRAHLFKRYAFANRFAAGKVVLDIPCGVGWGTSLLAARRRIGIDISAEAIAYAKAHYSGIEFLTGDMANIPLADGSVEVIVCLEGFEHVTRETGQRFLREAARVVQPGGLLVMTVPIIPEGGKHSGNPYHLHEPSLSELKGLVASDFHTELIETVETPNNPVAYFVGRSQGHLCVAKATPSAGRCEPRKAHVLLTTSAAPAQSPFSTSEKRPPLGIGFLISALRRAGHDVDFIDNYLQPSDFLEAGYLQQHHIDFVGVYANTICFRDTRRMFHAMERLRQTGQWQGKIIVGGPHTSVAPQTIPGFVDYVVQGEGERAIVDIVAGKVSERMVRYPRIENLDELPMPAWDCFVNKPYKWEVDFFSEKPVFTMNTSRGCPFGCTFCSVGSIWGKRYTCFSAERIVSDIEHVVSHYGAKGIYFREDNFTLDPKRLRRFCELMIEKGIRVPWVCESRVSTLTRELVELMARAGLRGFYFGVESGSQRMLDFMKKGITVEQTENAFRWCHELGVKPAASVVVGVPTETEADVAATRQLLQRVSPKITWTNVFVGIPDSPLYRHVLQNRAYEYVDDRGLVYLRGHNDRVRQCYHGRWNAEIPDAEERKDWTGKPKVSVLMAVHNGERFIRDALASIYRQTCQDFEVVIVDDGSTDRTPEILLEMKDARTSIYRNPSNVGLTKSLNTGLRLCRGEYVARMDADDVSDPKRFEAQVRFLDTHPHCLVVGTWCHRIDAQGQIIGQWKPKTSSAEVRERLQITNAVPHGSAMMRRAALVQAGGYNETYACAQDYDLWLRLLEKGDIENLPEQLYSLRSWEGAITAQKKSEQEACAERARREAQARRGLSVPHTIGKDNKRAVDCFANAWAEFNRSNFAAAVTTMEEYRKLVDYSQFERTPNEARTKGVIGLSVVVVTYNRANDLQLVLECLSKQEGLREPFEVIVVDNGQGVPHRVMPHIDQYIRCPANLNLSEGRNVGVHFARGRIVVFLDDDALVKPDYLASMQAAFDRFDIVGLRGRACPKTPVAGQINARVYDRGDKPFPTFCNQEGNSAWRREVFQAMGGMDPLLFGHEGNDLSYRIFKKSGKANGVIYWPAAVIYHDFGDADKSAHKNEMYRHNAEYLAHKHGADILACRKEIEAQPLMERVQQEPPSEPVVSHRNPLDEIALKHGTDKSSAGHDYMGAYYRYFAPLRDQPVKILEIGINKGYSLRTWHEFFPRAEIFAVDITPACKAMEGGRIHVFIGDQTDTAFLHSVVAAAGGGFDIVIDDGGHFVNQQITSFNALLSHVAPGGIYVIEDLHTSYWPSFGGGVGKPDTAVEFLKGLVDIVNRHGRKGRGSSPEAWREADRAEAESPAKAIESIEFCRSMCFIVKKPSGLSSRRQPMITTTDATASRRTGATSIPKVSVVLACCDGERFLAECIESILGQTLPEWELMILDDGSKDGTRRVIEQYARRDTRIRPYYFDDNRGPYVRRNLAIAQAHSDFIVIQDADDLMCPNKLERLHNAITVDERLGVVGSSYRMFLDGYPGEDHTEDVTPAREHEEIVKAFATEGTWDFCWHGSAIMRQRLFQEIGPYDENPFGSDSLWLGKAVAYARRTGRIRLQNIAEFLTLRRMRTDSQTGNLPLFDPRSRRAKFRDYCRSRLYEAVRRLEADPAADAGTELRKVVCSDFAARHSHLFEQWQNEPLTDDIVDGFIKKIFSQFSKGQYVRCLTTCAMAERIVEGLPQTVRCYDLVRGLAYFALHLYEASREYLTRECDVHQTTLAQDFCDRYLDHPDPGWRKADRMEIVRRCLLSGIGGADVSEGRAGIDSPATLRHVAAGNRHKVAKAGKNAGAPTSTQPPKVTVITACHNAEAFLGECIDSIRNQTLPEWELFLIDDGSRDGTRRIIEQYAAQDARIRPYFFDTNEGPYIRRNFAIQHAHSDFVVIQDADDLMLPTKLEVLYRQISSSDRLAMVGSQYRTFMDCFKGLPYTECSNLPLEHEEIASKFQSWLHAMSHGSAIIRRNMFDRIGLYDENAFASDSFWSAKLGTYVGSGGNVRLKNVPECLTLIRMHATNQTRLLSTLDPRNRRIRFRQYCEFKLRKIREKMASVPGTDIGLELRNCKCADFLTRFRTEIAQWESQPPDLRLLEKLLESAVMLFNGRFYISCINTLNGVEGMDPLIAQRVRGFELLRGMALCALDVRQRSRTCLEREIQMHDNPAAHQLLADAFGDAAVIDIQDWCDRNAGKFQLGLTNSSVRTASGATIEAGLQKIGIQAITPERSVVADATSMLSGNER